MFFLMWLYVKIRKKERQQTDEYFNYYYSKLSKEREKEEK
jgi:hypothetical protein